MYFTPQTSKPGYGPVMMTMNSNLFVFIPFWLWAKVDVSPSVHWSNAVASINWGGSSTVQYNRGV